MSCAVTIWVCRGHYAVSQRVKNLLGAIGVLTGLDSRVILSVIPPKDEGGITGAGLHQLGLLQCEVCEWERADDNFAPWTIEAVLERVISELSAAH